MIRMSKIQIKDLNNDSILKHDMSVIRMMDKSALITVIYACFIHFMQSLDIVF